MDYRLELVLLPVSDVDRARDFYVDSLGWSLVVDGDNGNGGRNVQVTPPGSSCAIGFGTRQDIGHGPIVTAAPGQQRGLHLVVEDIEAARADLLARGVDVGELRHLGNGGWAPGRHPTGGSYMTFAQFSDPDGNLWLLQEVHRQAPA